MKNVILSIVTILVSISFSIVYAQDNKAETQQHQQLQEIMKDSTAMKMLMENIAKDDHLRGLMMTQMMNACKDDSTKMTGMCRMMMQNQDTHKMMMGMMKPEKKIVASSNAPEILVKFKQDTKDNQITAMSSRLGLQQVKEMRPLRLRVFKITSGKNVQDVVKACEKEPFVEYAEPNQKYETKK